MFKNTASQKVTVFAFDYTTGAPKTGDAANLTVYVAKDDGSVTVLGDTSATEADATNAKGLYLFDLTQAETNADKLVFSGKSSTSNVTIVPITIYTRPPNFGALSINSSGQVDAIKIAGTTQTGRDLGASVLLSTGTGTGQLDFTSGVVKANVTQFGGTNLTATGGRPEVNTTHIAGSAVSTSTAQIGVNAVNIGGTAQTGRDLGASVLLSSGTGTGQIDFTSGVVKANLAQILGTALTETAGLLAGGFKKFFNIATPAATMDHLVLVDTVTTATTATNLTNAPTAGDFTATMKTSLNAATPAVTVSDKTGFSLSAAGVQAIWDALTSALTTVGSIGKLLVTDLDAAVSSRMATFTLPTNFSSLVIDSTGRVNAFLIGILTSVFTEGATGRIAGGFKQFFNIATPAATMDHGILVDLTTTTTTATTATNLTNAPTAGDFTATMKTSLNAATPAVTVSDKTGFSLSAGGIQAIWDALTSALTTVGSIGKLFVDNVNATISSRATPAQVNAEVVDGLATDTYAEPGQEAPAATAPLSTKIGYLYKLSRNKVTQDATTLKIYADDGSTVDQKSTVSDDGTTYTRDELATGP